MDVLDHDDALMVRQLSMYARDFQHVRAKYRELLDSTRRIKFAQMSPVAGAIVDGQMEHLQETGLACVIDSTGRLLYTDEVSRRFFAIRPGVMPNLSTLLEPHEWRTLSEGGACWVQSKYIDWSSHDPSSCVEMRDLELIPFMDDGADRKVLIGSRPVTLEAIRNPCHHAKKPNMAYAGMLVVDRHGKLLACDLASRQTFVNAGYAPKAWMQAIEADGNEDAIEAFKQRFGIVTGATNTPWTGGIQLRQVLECRVNGESELQSLWLNVKPLNSPMDSGLCWAMQFYRWSSSLVHMSPWTRSESSLLPPLALVKQCVRRRLERAADADLRVYLAAIEVQSPKSTTANDAKGTEQTLLKAIRGCDVATRIGVNRYAVVLDANESEFECLRVIRGIVRELTGEPARMRRDVGAWVGYVSLDAGEDLFEERLLQAEAALQKARQGPSGRVCSEREYGHAA